jgi:hypothetical protein
MPTCDQHHAAGNLRRSASPAYATARRNGSGVSDGCADLALLAQVVLDRLVAQLQFRPRRAF